MSDRTSSSRQRSHVTFAVAAVALTAMAAGGALTAARSTNWWWDNLGGPDSSHFSALDQINKSNVNQLQVAWFYPHGTTGFNPIVADDMMFVSGRNSSLIALDPTTGKEIWIHENIPGLSVRGVNYWQSEDGKDKRLIFTTTPGPFLQEIDARTGKSITSFGTNGYVDLREGLRNAGIGFRVPNPGKVYKNTIILGSATGEAWISPPGDLRAFDVVTGKRLWQFHTVPEPGEFGYETWPKDAYKYVGGANTWGEIAIDEERGIGYFPTGSPTYDFYGADRAGQNLFGNCLIALDLKTGKRLWHFQTIHHDLWDLDNVSAPQLVTVRQNGRRIDAVAHAGKTGFLYVFNRVTGEPLWPIEERAVPKSDVPGEQSWPTQPFPTKPEPFARQSFTADDINKWLLTPEQQAELRERVLKARNGTGPQGGIFIPPAVGEDSISMPGNQGGSNWGTTAADPDKGLVFVLGIDEVAILKLVNVKDAGAAGRGGFGNQAGAQAYAQYCAACHGQNLQNPLPGVPNLTGVTTRVADDVIRTMVTSGGGQMRPVPGITDLELAAVIQFLSAGAGRGGGFGRGGANVVFPPGPVVASGGVPTPALAPDTRPEFGGRGPTGGNAAYPAGVEAPAMRFATGYNVMGTSTSPPYSRLTAYDLNTGTIKWQVPVGDDPQTVARGGPANTGAVGLRTGIMPTKAGLVFLADGDGKVRAYDEETGKVLWTGTTPAGSRGVPAVYQAKGKQYLVVVAQPGGGRNGGGRGGEAPTLAPDAPRGYIAFALPSK
ncbi:MAG: PQQ-binding-like beta-propeller repeat protein [Acidobacteria bacterium]|nr:PQQ-binding-like beta-propeller repeat protein [Acidobacteriota bacterium]